MTATATARAIFAGLTEKLDYIKDLGVTAHLAAAVLSFAAQGRRLRHCRLLRRASDVRHAGGFQGVPARGAPARLAGHHRTGAEPHLRPAPVVSARAPRQPRQPLAELLCLERLRRKNTRDARIIFKDVEVSNWTWDPVAKAYYWHRFFSHQPDLNFDNPEVHRENDQGGGFLARPGRGRPAAGCGAVSLRTRRHQLRKSAGDARVSEKAARARGRKISATACCWPKPTNGRRTRWPISARAAATNATWRFIFR